MATSNDSTLILRGPFSPELIAAIQPLVTRDGFAADWDGEAFTLTSHQNADILVLFARNTPYEAAAQYIGFAASVHADIAFHREWIGGIDSAETNCDLSFHCAQTNRTVIDQPAGGVSFMPLINIVSALALGAEGLEALLPPARLASAFSQVQSAQSTAV